jgi:hypothetical protein
MLIKELVKNAVRDRVLGKDAKNAVELLCEHNMLGCTQNKKALTQRSLLYIFIVTEHVTPIAAASLLSTLHYLSLQNPQNPLTDEDLSYILKNVVYLGDLTILLDRLYPLKPGREELRMYVEWFLQLCTGNEKHVEIRLNLLIIRVRERMRTSGKKWSLDAFEDEFNMALNSMSRQRDDLQSRAYDPESAIQPLMPREEDCLQKASQHYQSKILEKGGVERCYAELLGALKTRYEQAPIVLEVELPCKHSRKAHALFPPVAEKTRLILPLEREAFEQLKLTSEDRARALLLYYRHPLHSAYRFFKDVDSPGPWLADDKYWESYQKHKEILVILWLAVTDEEMPPTSDYTIEGRIEHFINSFSDFRRDKNNQGRRMRADGSGRFEYYDDGLADKPGCSLGFRDRVFDAVQGHPLFEFSPQLLLWEVKTRIRAHFKTILDLEMSQDDLADMKNYWHKMINGELLSLEKAQKSACHRLFSKLDVPIELQHIWLKELEEKYPSLKENIDLTHQYWAYFQLTPIHETHLYRFCDESFELLLKIDGKSGQTESASTVPYLSV